MVGRRGTKTSDVTRLICAARKPRKFRRPILKSRRIACSKPIAQSRFTSASASRLSIRLVSVRAVPQPLRRACSVILCAKRKLCNGFIVARLALD